MKPFFHYVIIAFILSGFILTNLSAQIITQTNPPLEEMVKRIVGEGVYFDNVTYQGYHIAKAMFENGNTTNLGLDKGILLCTGDPYYIPGPNESCAKHGCWSTPGHPLLDAIQVQYSTTDASILEFDVVPESDTLRFRYVFGSETYNEFIL